MTVERYPDTCLDGGYLVNAERPVAEDPTEVYAVGLPEVIGCGNIVCGDCGSLVRQAPGVVPRPDRDAARVYADWKINTQPAPSPGIWRLYSCSCVMWLEPDRQALDDREPGTPSFPWRCAGHPRVTLPFSLDGETLEAGTPWDSLAARTLLHPPALARKGERAIQAGWARKLYVRLRGRSEAGALARAVTSHLDAADPALRSASLQFFTTFPGAPGSERVVELACTDRAIFADPAVEPAWLQAVAVRLGVVPLDEEARALAREEAFRPGERALLVRALADMDEDWLLAHPEAWMPHDAARWKVVLRVLSYTASPRLGEAAVLVVTRLGVRAETVEAWIAEHLRWDLAAEAVAAIRTYERVGYVIGFRDVREVLEQIDADQPPLSRIVARWRCGPPAEADALAADCARLLSTPDVRLRARAAAFFLAVPEAPDSGALASAFAAEGDATDPFAKRHLRESLLLALLARVPKDQGALAAVQAEALRPGGARTVVKGLGAGDPTWLAQNAARIAQATPAATADLLRALSRSGQRLPPVLAELARAVPPERLRQAVLDAFKAGPTRDEALTFVPGRRPGT